MFEKSASGTVARLAAFAKHVIPYRLRVGIRAFWARSVEELLSRYYPNAIVSLDERIRRLERQVFARPYLNPEFIRAHPNPTPKHEFDYVGFEQKFRGPSSVIQQKLGFYIQYFVGRQAVVDLGCGRGEFLEVLREAGIAALGVEVHPGQAAEARRKGLNVVESDLFDYLRACQDEAVDGLFSAQVVEHLPFSKLNLLFKLSYRKLKPGGIMISETVNPHCTAAFKFFYLDPTHVAPLYPEVLQFLAESAGFDKVLTVYPVIEGDPQHLYHECGEYAVVAERQ